MFISFYNQLMSSTFNVGDRVVCIPFKHKGKVATVRFYGSIGRKFGTWVGLELDEPTGECSGDFNGEYLFECQENYGLVLRNTQVKLYDSNEALAKPVSGASAQAKLTLDDNNFGGNDSPLVSPTNKAQASQEETKQGWRDKLEKLKVKKLEEKTKVVQPDDPELDKIRSSFAPTSGIRRNDDGSLEVSQSEVATRSFIPEQTVAKDDGGVSAPTKLGVKRPTLNMKDVEAGLPKEESAKDRLEKNRLAAVEKKKELQAKQEALAQQRNMRQAAVATPRSSGTSKIGFGAQPVATPRTASNLRNQSNLKGATAKTGASGIAKANAYQSTTEKPVEKPIDKPVESDTRRPAMTQPLVDPGTKRAPSASRLAGTARDPKADTLTKKVPPGKVTASVGGKTPLKQTMTSADTLNKSLAPKEIKAPIVQSTFTSAEIKLLEGQLKQKEDEITNLHQEVETHKQKIGSMMIKHNNEVKRQQEEISLLKKQVESSTAQTGEEESQAQIAATLALLEQSKDAERQAQERIAELEEQVSAIRDQLADAKKQSSQVQTNAAVKIEEYELEIQRLHKDYQDQSQNSNQAVAQKLQAELQQKLDHQKKELSDQIAKQAKDLQAAEKLIEKLRVDVREEQERREEEVEILKLEKDALIDEKKEIMDRYMESAKVEEEDPLKDIGIEEIKIQNKKLRQAITTLTFGFEEERKRLELKMSQETEKDKIIADQDQRLKQMDILLDELEQKDQEMADMRDKFDEILEYEIMVEEMVQEIANKDGEVEEMTERMLEIEEEHAMLEELVENLETYNKELQDEIAEKEKDIQGLNQEKEQLETIVIDQDGITSKYKERQTQLSKQISVLTEQLEITVSSTGNKDQVSILLEKQQALISKLRDAAKKSLEITKERITTNQLKMQADIVQQMLPESLAEEALLPSLEKIQILNVTKHKAMLLIRQVCENFLDNAKNVYEDPDQLQVYVQTLLKICLMSHRIIECASTVQYQVANMTPGQYDEITKLLVWQQVKVTQNELDQVLELLLDEALGQNFEASSLEQAIQQMENLRSRTEKTFITVSPEELKQQELSGKQEVNPSLEQQKRQNLARICPKLNYRTAALKVALSVIFVPHLQEKFDSPEEKHHMQIKVTLIYQRLMQSILKIDFIDNRQPGEEFFQESLNSDLSLQRKYETFKMLWDGTPAQKSDAKKKNWLSVIEAVERDITQLTNDYKFKKLTTMVDERYGDKRLDLNDLYAVDFEASGPWRTVAQTIRTDLQDMGALRLKITNVQEQQKQAAFQVLQLKREKEENIKIVTTLETKLGQALAKAEQLNALELERDEQNQKIQNLQKKLDSEAKDNAQSKASLEEAKKKLEEAKKTIAEKAAAPAQEQPSQSQNRGGASRRQQTGIKGHAKDFFTGLQNSNNRDGRDQMTPLSRSSTSGGNPAQIIQSAQATEDMYINIINDLQSDRMRLRGKDMTARLNNLQKPESAFSKLIQQTKENKVSQTPRVKLNSEEQAKIEVALNSVETLKSKFKRSMATARIVDLTKFKEASASTAPLSPLEVEKAVEEHQKRNSQQFNFLLVEARNKMNDALEFLFQKDSTLRNLQNQTTETALSSHKEMETPAKVGEIKIGSLKLRGKLQLPQRKVVLDEAALAELRRNVQLLTI